VRALPLWSARTLPPATWLALTALALSAFSSSRLVENSAALAPVLDAWWRPLSVLHFGALALTGVAIWRAWRGAFDFATAFALGPVVAVAGWLAFVAWGPPFQRLWAELALAPGAGAWTLALFGATTLGGRRPRLAGLAVRALALLAFAVVLTEVGLRVVSRVSGSPLFAHGGETERAVIERFRCAPGLVRFGFPCNSRGFYDSEFLRRAPSEHLVVALGDSFLLGSVPHELNWTTLAERALETPIANFGVAGIGPREYLRLLVEEALPLDPDFVVVSVFVGNDLDLAPGPEELPDPWLRQIVARENVRLFTVAGRLLRWHAETDRLGTSPAWVQGERTSRVAESELIQTFPWLTDPALEEATLSEDAYQRLELERARRIGRGDEVAFARLTSTLTEIRNACAGRKLLIVLVPDEFQVEDELWRALANGAHVELVRDRPQRELGAWLERAGVATLDLLPTLRSVPPLADGRRHVYHLRDTHFNARGNRVAADALSRALIELGLR
jgi:hypothetical protein